MTSDSDANEPVGEDARGSVRGQDFLDSECAGIVAIALGGGTGALVRWSVSSRLLTGAGQFPWATFAVNVLGCLLIGVLMVLVTEVWSPHRLVRLFLGVGVLGGFTTFSTYAVEIHELLKSGSVLTGIAYLLSTLVCALLAVLLGTACARWMTGASTGTTTAS